MRIIPFILIFLLSISLVNAASVSSPEPRHLVRLVVSEKVWSNNNQSVETIPIPQLDIIVTAGNRISTAQTDDVGELPIYLGSTKELSWETTFNGETLTGTIDPNNFYLKKHPLTNETIYYNSVQINFDTYPKWDPLNPFTYNLGNITHFIILSVASGIASLTIVISALYVKYKIKQFESHENDVPNDSFRS